MFRLWSRISRRKRSENKNGWHSRFVRQEIPGYSPIITGNRVLAFFICATIILIPLGAAILAASLGVVEHKIRYDSVGTPFATNDRTTQQQALWQSGDVGVPTTVSFTTTKRMNQPVRPVDAAAALICLSQSCNDFWQIELCCRAICMNPCCRYMYITSYKDSTKITKGAIAPLMSAATYCVPLCFVA